MSRETITPVEVLCQAGNCGVVAVDSARNVLALNPQAEHLTGVKAAEALCLDALPKALQTLISETLLNGRAIHHPSVQLQTVAGHEVTVSVNLSPIKSACGTVRGVIAVLNDLAPGKLLKQQLRRLDQLASIGTLSAGMAHEIKNALVAIRTFVDLLLKRNKDAELAGIVSREMVRVDSIVSQTLKFAGPAKAAFVEVDLHEVLDQSLGLVQAQLEGRKIQLIKSYQASPARTLGDAYQLEQAFLNLLLNAIEAMGPDGHLQVATDLATPHAGADLKPQADDARWLRVQIQDTGVGIPPENRERLFEPFFTTKPQGTGLGLSITRRIVQDHHGSITFDSELNQGTCFSILLPPAAANP